LIVYDIEEASDQKNTRHFFSRLDFYR